MKILYYAHEPQICVGYMDDLKLNKEHLPKNYRLSPSGMVVWQSIQTWQDAEEFFAKGCDNEEFTDIVHLSKKDAIFPFDFSATYEDKKYVIDVTMRKCKPVRTKCLSVWRVMGYIPAIFFVLPQKELGFSLFAEIESGDTEVRITKSIIHEVRTSWIGPEWKPDTQQQLKVRS